MNMDDLSPDQMAVAERALLGTRASYAGEADPVATPAHYAHYAIEPLDFVLANRLEYSEGNVIKYVCRWRYKGGVEDLKKARHYLDRMIAEAERTHTFQEPSPY